MKSKLNLLLILLALIYPGMLPAFSAAQQRRFDRIGKHHLAARFADGTLRFDFAGRTLTKFEFHRTNSEGNFCDIETARNSSGSRWRTENNVTRIEIADASAGNQFKSNGEIIIKRFGSRFEIIFEIKDNSQICGLGRQLPSRIEVSTINRRIKVKVIE